MNENTHCGHDGCGACCGGTCGGCGTLELTADEAALLRQLAQTPFLPVARDPDSGQPVCLEAAHGAAAGLAQKRLIDVDYDLPLANCAYAGYEGFSCRGSMALTARGQAVLDILEIQGAL